MLTWTATRQKQSPTEVRNTSSNNGMMTRVEFLTKSYTTICCMQHLIGDYIQGKDICRTIHKNNKNIRKS